MGANPVACLSIVAVASLAAASQPAQDLSATFLRGPMGFTTSDLDAVRAGKPIVRLLDRQDGREIALGGAVRINATPAVYVQRLRDIVAFEHLPGVVQIGKLSLPVHADDFRALTLEASDLASLAHCESGDCDVQLSAEMIRRFRASVAWNTPAAAGQANALMRKMLADAVEAYGRAGHAGLGAYLDNDAPTSIADEFRSIVATQRLPVPLPEFTRALTNYPGARLAGSEEFFYWTKVAFGMKPTIRLNHVTIYPLANRPDGLRYAIAIEQLYASHYFSSTLELKFLVDDPAAPGRAFVLLDASTSRTPGLSGLMGLLIRHTVKSRARQGMEKYLGFTKEIVEGKR